MLSNHDVTRTVTRYGRADTGFDFATKAHGIPTDLDLGTRRARAAALLTLALPGSVYLYQGEELGLPEVEDIPADRRQDPMFLRTGGTDPGRDGCRVPLPWSGDRRRRSASARRARRPSRGCRSPPTGRRARVEAQSGDPDSMLALYRAALRLRRQESGLGDGPMEWLAGDAGGARLPRGTAASPASSTSAGRRVALPGHREVLLASGPLDEGALPTDTAVWLRT